MKKIVPFTNDIKFNTKIYEISSISLEHNLKLKEKDYISGEFIVSGEYKMTDSSINTEPFIYGLPFDISLDDKYDVDKMKIDIDDFHFEIINDEILRVNIDVLIEGVQIIELEETEEIIKPDVIISEEKNKDEEIEEKIEEKEDRLIVNSKIEDLFKENESEGVEVINIEEEKPKEVTSIFNNFKDQDDKYVTYHVHIVRENDNIESICTKYKVQKEDLLEYNDLKELTLGDKIIIPYVFDETI